MWTERLANYRPGFNLMKVTFHKAFVRPYLDYVCPPPWFWWYSSWSSPQCIVSSEIRVSSIQCLLAITGGLRVSSWKKLYQELGFESLHQCRWYRKTKSSKQKSSFIILTRNPSYITRNHASIPLFKTNHNFYKIRFFHLLLSNKII